VLSAQLGINRSEVFRLALYNILKETYSKKELDILASRDDVVDEWIELNKKSINKALSLAGISFSPKNDLEGLGRHETDNWIWDLDMMGTKTKGFTMTMRIEEMKRNSNNFILSFIPYEIKPCDSVVMEKRPTHKEAMEIFNKYAKIWLNKIIEKGLRRKIVVYDDCADYEWVYGGKNPIKFRISYPIRGLGLEKEFGWKILQHPKLICQPKY